MYYLLQLGQEPFTCSQEIWNSLMDAIWISEMFLLLQY